MTERDGGPAFPFGVRVDRHDSYTGERREGYEENEPGMSLRDYFAAQILASCGRDMLHNTMFHHEWSVRCYELADAMLKAREERR